MQLTLDNRKAMKRRDFLNSTFAVSLVLPAYASFNPLSTVRPPHLKLSLNAYSFNRALREGSMSLDDLLDFCAQFPFDAVDPTAYYFPGYPQVPEDAFLYDFKRKAFAQGLAISGTGVRNDYTLADNSARKADLQLVEKWIVAAAKMGAPTLRVFAGREINDRSAWKKAWPRLIDGLKASADFGGKHGVMVNLQNHYEYLKTADEVEAVIQEVNHPWLGLMLDIGSLRNQPYQEVRQLVPYARSWQVKGNVYRNGKAEKTDISRIVKIASSAGYRGYFLLETLGEGDPKVKVRKLLDEAQLALQV
jgi:sugar phosphate isomerase/epimerase